MKTASIFFVFFLLCFLELIQCTGLIKKIKTTSASFLNEEMADQELIFYMEFQFDSIYTEFYSPFLLVYSLSFDEAQWRPFNTEEWLQAPLLASGLIQLSECHVKQSTMIELKLTAHSSMKQRAIGDPITFSLKSSSSTDAAVSFAESNNFEFFASFESPLSFMKLYDVSTDENYNKRGELFEMILQVHIVKSTSERVRFVLGGRHQFTQDSVDKLKTLADYSNGISEVHSSKFSTSLISTQVIEVVLDEPLPAGDYLFSLYIEASQYTGDTFYIYVYTMMKNSPKVIEKGYLYIDQEVEPASWSEDYPTMAFSFGIGSVDVSAYPKSFLLYASGDRSNVVYNSLEFKLKISEEIGVEPVSLELLLGDSSALVPINFVNDDLPTSPLKKAKKYSYSEGVLRIEGVKLETYTEYSLRLKVAFPTAKTLESSKTEGFGVLQVVYYSEEDDSDLILVRGQPEIQKKLFKVNENYPLLPHQSLEEYEAFKLYGMPTKLSKWDYESTNLRMYEAMSSIKTFFIDGDDFTSLDPKSQPFYPYALDHGLKYGDNQVLTLTGFIGMNSFTTGESLKDYDASNVLIEVATVSDLFESSSVLWDDDAANQNCQFITTLWYESQENFSSATLYQPESSISIAASYHESNPDESSPEMISQCSLFTDKENSFDLFRMRFAEQYDSNQSDGNSDLNVDAIALFNPGHEFFRVYHEFASNQFFFPNSWAWNGIDVIAFHDPGHEADGVVLDAFVSLIFEFSQTEISSTTYQNPDLSYLENLYVFTRPDDSPFEDSVSFGYKILNGFFSGGTSGYQFFEDLPSMISMNWTVGSLPSSTGSNEYNRIRLFFTHFKPWPALKDFEDKESSVHLYCSFNGTAVFRGCELYSSNKLFEKGEFPRIQESSMFSKAQYIPMNMIYDRTYVDLVFDEPLKENDFISVDFPVGIDSDNAAILSKNLLDFYIGLIDSEMVLGAFIGLGYGYSGEKRPGGYDMLEPYWPGSSKKLKSLTQEDPSIYSKAIWFELDSDSTIGAETSGSLKSKCSASSCESIQADLLFCAPWNFNPNGNLVGEDSDCETGFAFALEGNTQSEHRWCIACWNHYKIDEIFEGFTLPKEAGTSWPEETKGVYVVSNVIDTVTFNTNIQNTKMTPKILKFASSGNSILRKDREIQQISLEIHIDFDFSSDSVLYFSSVSDSSTLLLVQYFEMLCEYSVDESKPYLCSAEVYADQFLVSSFSGDAPKGKISINLVGFGVKNDASTSKRRLSAKIMKGDYLVAQTDDEASSEDERHYIEYKEELADSETIKVTRIEKSVKETGTFPDILIEILSSDNALTKGTMLKLEFQFSHRLDYLDPELKCYFTDQHQSLVSQAGVCLVYQNEFQLILELWFSSSIDSSQINKGFLFIEGFPNYNPKNTNTITIFTHQFKTDIDSDKSHSLSRSIIDFHIPPSNSVQSSFPQGDPEIEMKSVAQGVSGWIEVQFELDKMMTGSSLVSLLLPHSFPREPASNKTIGCWFGSDFEYIKCGFNQTNPRMIVLEGFPQTTLEFSFFIHGVVFRTYTSNETVTSLNTLITPITFLLNYWEDGWVEGGSPTYSFVSKKPELASFSNIIYPLSLVSLSFTSLFFKEQTDIELIFETQKPIETSSWLLVSLNYLSMSHRSPQNLYCSLTEDQNNIENDISGTCTLIGNSVLVQITEEISLYTEYSLLITDELNPDDQSDLPDPITLRVLPPDQSEVLYSSLYYYDDIDMQEFSEKNSTEIQMSPDFSIQIKRGFYTEFTLSIEGNGPFYDVLFFRIDDNKEGRVDLEASREDSNGNSYTWIGEKQKKLMIGVDQNFPFSELELKLMVEETYYPTYRQLPFMSVQIVDEASSLEKLGVILLFKGKQNFPLIIKSTEIPFDELFFQSHQVNYVSVSSFSLTSTKPNALVSFEIISSVNYDSSQFLITLSSASFGFISDLTFRAEYSTAPASSGDIEISFEDFSLSGQNLNVVMNSSPSYSFVRFALGPLGLVELVSESDIDEKFQMGVYKDREVFFGVDYIYNSSQNSFKFSQLRAGCNYVFRALWTDLDGNKGEAQKEFQVEAFEGSSHATFNLTFSWEVSSSSVNSLMCLLTIYLEANYDQLVTTQGHQCFDFDEIYFDKSNAFTGSDSSQESYIITVKDGRRLESNEENGFSDLDAGSGVLTLSSSSSEGSNSSDDSEEDQEEEEELFSGVQVIIFDNNLDDGRQTESFSLAYELFREKEAISSLNSFISGIAEVSSISDVEEYKAAASIELDRSFTYSYDSEKMELKVAGIHADIDAEIFICMLHSENVEDYGEILESVNVPLVSKGKVAEEIMCDHWAEVDPESQSALLRSIEGETAFFVFFGIRDRIPRPFNRAYQLVETSYITSSGEIVDEPDTEETEEAGYLVRFMGVILASLIVLAF